MRSDFLKFPTQVPSLFRGLIKSIFGLWTSAQATRAARRPGFCICRGEGRPLRAYPATGWDVAGCATNEWGESRTPSPGNVIAAPQTNALASLS